MFDVEEAPRSVGRRSAGFIKMALVFAGLAGLGAFLAWWFVLRTASKGLDEDVELVFVVTKAEQPEIVDYLAYAGFRVEHGRLATWEERHAEHLREAGEAEPELANGDPILRVVDLADRRGAGHLAIESPTPEQLEALGSVIEIPTPPDGARWLAVPVGDFALADGAHGSWSEPGRDWVRAGGPGALQALMQQPALDMDRLSEPSEATRERRDFIKALEGAEARLEDLPRMERQRQKFRDELFGPAEDGEGIVVTGAFRRGAALPLDSTHWVMLTSELALESETGYTLDPRESTTLELAVGGFDQEPAPVLDEEGHPTLFGADTVLLPSSDGRAFFVRGAEGAQRAYAVGPGASVRLLGRFEPPERKEKPGTALSKEGKLARVVDTGAAAWLRVHDLEGGSVDLVPVPGEQLLSPCWVDEHQVLAIGRQRDGGRADVLWRFDLRAPEEDVALVSRELGRRRKGDPSGAAPILQELRLTDAGELRVLEIRHDGWRLIPVQLVRDAEGHVTGLNVTSEGWSGPGASPTTLAPSGEAMCWSAGGSPGKGVYCARARGESLVPSGLDLEGSTLPRRRVRTDRPPVSAMDRDGRLVLIPVVREFHRLDEPVVVTLGWRIGTED